MADVFHKQYRQLDATEQKRITEIKDGAQALYDVFDASLLTGADPRAIAMAKTNLEQSVMWAVKAITG